MFKYIYKVSPIDSWDGTMTIKAYINYLVDKLNILCDLVIADGINVLETKNCGNDHIFQKIERIGQAVEFICSYFKEHDEEFYSGIEGIRVFSVPTEGECEISYIAKAANNGTTYIFSDLYFPFMNRSDCTVEKLSE